MKTKHNPFLLFCIALILILSGCIQTVQEQKPANENIVQEQEDTVTFTLRLFDSEGQLLLDESLDVKSGSNAFEAMQQMVKIDYEDYGSMGVFVKGIGGTSPPQGYYFALYVDGVYANKGISSHSIEENTLIEWKMEKIEEFGLK